MKKLLHERLKEYANNKHSLVCDDFIQLVGLECTGQSCTDCGREVFNLFVDEIERYYIPRPCDQEGKPWKIGDPISPLNATSDSHVTGYIYDGKEWYLQYRWVGRDNERDELVRYCKRPQPKVLDADSVETKEGDTVWSRAGVEYIVIEIESESRVHLRIPGEIESFVIMPCDCLTHKEPDSLEKLRDDMKRWLEYFPIEADGIAIKEWSDRLSALIEKSV